MLPAVDGSTSPTNNIAFSCESEIAFVSLESDRRSGRSEALILILDALSSSASLDADNNYNNLAEK